MTFWILTNYFRKLQSHFLYIIPHEVVFKDFAYFLGTTDLI